MTQQDKELLLRDLCYRSPYGVICQITFDKEDIHIESLESVRPFMTFNQITTIGSVVSIENVKPYLRPISSMTDEEVKEYNALFYIHLDGETYCENWEWMDWMNAHHFDYRDLLEKDLAIEVTKENNPYE